MANFGLFIAETACKQGQQAGKKASEDYLSAQIKMLRQQPQQQDRFIGTSRTADSTLDHPVNSEGSVTGGVNNVEKAVPEAMTKATALQLTDNVEMKNNCFFLSDIYKSLYNQGIKGQGIKVGVVDSLSLHYRSSGRVTVLESEPHNISTEFDDHGNKVVGVLLDALPESHIMNAVSANSKRELKEELNSAIQKIKNGEVRTRKEIRELILPTYINHITKAVQLSIENGAKVVNVSQGPEVTLKSLYNELDKKTNWQLPAESLADLQEGYDALFKPWKKVLDDAAAKEIPIILAAGNNANMEVHALDSKAIKHIFNPLALKKHPALIVVGSTDERGNVSYFSSVYPSELLPDIAANGEYQVKPLGSTEAFGGSSCAAPDITALYVMMQSARHQAGKEPLTIIQFRKILQEAANRASLSYQYRAYLRGEEQIERTPELVRARVGDSGTMTNMRLWAIELAKVADNVYRQIAPSI